MYEIWKIKKVNGTIVNEEKVIRCLRDYLSSLPDGEHLLKHIQVQRTPQQNRYYRMLARIWARAVNWDADDVFKWAKQYLYPPRVQSSAELDKDEFGELIMTIQQCLDNAGIKYPSPDEYEHNHQ